MDSPTYIAGAIRTESVPEQIVVNQLTLHSVMEVIAGVTALADQLKRKVFYGKDFDQDKLGAALMKINAVSGMLGCALVGGEDFGNLLPQKAVDEATAGTAVTDLNLAHINVRLLHAALGCFTESGELVEAIQKQYETGQLDLTNFGEEVGDLEWYQAIAFDETKVTEAHCRERNIAKLKARYPERFDADKAVNRDLATERKILEDGQA